MKALMCAVVFALFAFAAPVQAVDTTVSQPKQELEQYNARRACMKKCIDNQGKCNKSCTKGHVVDRACKHKCQQTRDACIKACM